MSLYVGNLSHHVSQEDLVRVFERFGRCRVQLKDGYGFAIYEARADAERALRALRGKYVCGGQISLSWSNKQPRYSQRSERVARFYEPFRRRIPREESDGGCIRGSQDRGDFNARPIRPPSYNHEGQLNGALDRKAGQMSSDVIETEGDKGLGLRDHLLCEGGINGDNHVEVDRWGEPGTDTVNSHGIENGHDFDRYEPCGDTVKHENKKLDSSYESREKGIAREKRWREYSTDDTDRKLHKTKPQQACYICGQVGHIKRNCPEAESGRGKFNKFIHIREELNIREKGERGLKRSRPSSWAKSDASRDPAISMRHKRDRKDSYSGKSRKLAKTRLSIRGSREKNQPKLKGDSQSKKRNKMEHRDPRRSVRRHRARKSRTATPSQSPRTSSRSHSKARKSNSGSSSSSRPRSASPRPLSASSRSSSVSKSSFSRPLISRSRSRSRSPSRSSSRSRSPSRSSSRSLSLSVSLEQKHTSKNIKVDTCVDTSSKEHVKKGTSPELNDNELNGTCSKLEDGNPRASFQVNNETNEEPLQPLPDDDTARNSTLRFDLNECSSFSEFEKDAEAPLWKPNRQISTTYDTNTSARMTTQEMLSALKHYGLEAPKDSQTASIDDYFGAACLWPWEMIYYRRLRKGPISTVNYARRLQQNQEFGIVDKYIRSSSSWGEYCEDET